MRYDPKTQTVVAVELIRLLSDVFHGRKCSGSIYSVRRTVGSAQADFRRAVDATYMAHRHGSSFVAAQPWASGTTITRNRVVESGIECDPKAVAQLAPALRRTFHGLDWTLGLDQCVREKGACENWPSIVRAKRKAWARHLRTRRREWARGFLAASRRPRMGQNKTTSSPASQLRTFFATYRGLAKFIGGFLLRFYTELHSDDVVLRRVIALASGRSVRIFGSCTAVVAIALPQTFQSTNSRRSFAAGATRTIHAETMLEPCVCGARRLSAASSYGDECPRVSLGGDLKTVARLSFTDRNCLVFDFDNFKFDVCAQPIDTRGWRCPGCNLIPMQWFDRCVTKINGREVFWSQVDPEHHVVDLAPVLAEAQVGFRHAGCQAVCDKCERVYDVGGWGGTCNNPNCGACDCDTFPAYKVQTHAPLWHEDISHVHMFCPRAAASIRTALVVSVYGGIVAL